METKNTYTLITGGSAGIGLELAKIFAKNGHNLILVARDENELESAKGMIEHSDIEVVIMPKDLFEPDAPFELYEEVVKRGLPVEILVNNAGQGHYGEFADTDINRELAIIQLNISSLVVLTKCFLRDMLGRGGGRILNTSSIASKTPGPWQAVYHGTKAFVQSFSEAVREEVKDKNVTITTLLPGATDTDFFNKAEMTESKIVTEGKLDDPEVVAQDGYDALMKGEDMIVSGWKNKMTVAMSSVTPDEILAKKMYKKQAPSDKEKK